MKELNGLQRRVEGEQLAIPLPWVRQDHSLRGTPARGSICFATNAVGNTWRHIYTHLILQSTTAKKKKTKLSRGVPLLWQFALMLAPPQVFTSELRLPSHASLPSHCNALLRVQNPWMLLPGCCRSSHDNRGAHMVVKPPVGCLVCSKIGLVGTCCANAAASASKYCFKKLAVSFWTSSRRELWPPAD